MVSDALKEQVLQLPDLPGVYRYFNSDNELLYVGKAKSLKKRVGSYFQKFDSLDVKTRRLVSLIDHLEYTVVPTEFDALILENHLIKQHQPRYNILLKDDKTYPYVCVTEERFPRVVTTRRKDEFKGTYYGPFTSVGAMNTVVEHITKIFQLRTCYYALSEKNVQENKFKVCLEYHLGNCKGPCENLQEEQEYLQHIKQVHQILKGNISSARQFFKEAMLEASSHMEFEKAHQLKVKLEKLERFHHTSVVVNPSITDADVFAIASNEQMAVVSYLKVLNGMVLQSRNTEIKKRLNETEEEIIIQVMINIRETNASESKEIISNVAVEYPEDGLQLTVPQRGDKVKLIQLALKNAQQRLLKYSGDVRDERAKRILSTLQKDLHLSELPDHIECFDNSNFQGTDAVSAMVCFKNAKPSKKDYRHFNVKNVVGPDDFATMKETVGRRYKRALEEEQSLPKLIIIDGGKGQLSAACEALHALGLYGKIPIIGIAKNLEEIFFPGDQYPIYIDKKSESLRLIQYLRDEAHRFGITHHRKKRSKTSLHSSLQGIPEVGEATIEKLLKTFKSVKRIKSAALSELEACVGESKALKVFQYFQENEGKNNS
ncbi:MAG: excinuclease ABC subunit UvrC [Cytophagaceae bacterium]|jgi:excinuclease ABC subunit C|nr:excinuclease ABC subunit UvrC [Cytophagaceae bacterium]